MHLPASFPVFSPLRGESCHFLPYHSFACLHSFTKYVSICKQHFVQIYVYFMYIYYIYLSLMACRGPRFDPWVRKIPWRRKWQPTPVFLPGEFHGQRSLAGYGPRGRKESDMSERLTLSLFYSYYYKMP